MYQNEHGPGCRYAFFIPGKAEAEPERWELIEAVHSVFSGKTPPAGYKVLRIYPDGTECWCTEWFAGQVEAAEKRRRIREHRRAFGRYRDYPTYSDADPGL